MRRLYSLLIYLATPFLLLYFAFRGIRDKNYLKRWAERFACFSAPDVTGGIVIHAASVGEVNVAGPMIQAVARRFEDYPLTITTLTPTGSGRVRALFADEIFHVYAPIDLPGAVKRFFDRIQPRLLIIMETEIWPNLYCEAAARGIPVMIANARISQRSISGYRRLRALTGLALEQLSRAGAQSDEDARRLIEIGAREDRVEVTGNMKFDVTMPASLTEQGEFLRQLWGPSRPVLLAGSTHEGDEGPLLAAFGKILKSHPQALLILVPRHPERFQKAAQSARSRGLSVVLRSDNAPCPTTCQCLLIDTMGELPLFYAACDVAFVGGSLDNTGGHNVLEPAALSRPVLVGPHTFNFKEITEQLIAAGGAIRVCNADEIEQAVDSLFGDPDRRDRMGRAGLDLVRGGQGALQRTLNIVEDLL